MSSASSAVPLLRVTSAVTGFLFSRYSTSSAPSSPFRILSRIRASLPAKRRGPGIYLPEVNVINSHKVNGTRYNKQEGKSSMKRPVLICAALIAAT
jgi:hypothetical protein